MPKLKPSFIMAAVAIILLACLPFVPKWFHSKLTTNLNIGYLWLGIPLALACLYLLLHALRKNSELTIQKNLIKRLRSEFLEEHQDKINELLKARPVPEEIAESKNIYHDISIRNYWAYRVLGVTSLAASLFLTAALGNIISNDIAKILAFISSLCTGIIFSFNLVEKSNRARKSFRLLHDAMLRYQYRTIDIKQLLESYKQAEEYLGDDEWNGGPISGSSTASKSSS